MLIWIQSPFDNLPQEGYRHERYFLMAEAFIAAGHEVVYWTTDFNHGTKARRLGVKDATDTNGIHLRLIAVPAYVNNVSLRRIFSHCIYARRLANAAKLAANERQPDLVISATPTLGAAEVMRRLAGRCGAKFVIDLQDAWPETFYRLLPCGLRWLGRILLAGMHLTARRLYAEANFVTGVSERYRAIAARPDFYLAYHGVAFHPQHSTATIPLVARPTSLLYLGNLGAGYDLETVIKAVAASPRLTLDIAGLGPKESALKEKVRLLGLEKRVRFHGYLHADALAALAETCEVGVIPMRDDSWVGLTYKLGDYLSAGLRVVSSLHGECGAFLAREHLGAVYDFGSPESLLAALDALVELPADKKNLPEALRADCIYPKYVAFVTSSAKTCPST